MAYTPGKGTTIATSTATFAQVVSIKPPSIDTDIIDVTHLGSSWKEKLRSIPDGGEVGFTLEYDSGAATHTSLLTILTTSAVRTFTITLNATAAAADVITVTGLMTANDWGELTIDNVATIDVAVAVTGAVTIG